MHLHSLSGRKIQLGILVAAIFGANALAMIQMVRIDLQSQLVEMGYLSEEGDEAEMYFIPPRKPDFSNRFTHKEA